MTPSLSPFPHPIISSPKISSTVGKLRFKSTVVLLSVSWFIFGLVLISLIGEREGKSELPYLLKTKTLKTKTIHRTGICRKTENRKQKRAVKTIPNRPLFFFDTAKGVFRLLRFMFLRTGMASSVWGVGIWKQSHMWNNVFICESNPFPFKILFV